MLIIEYFNYKVPAMPTTHPEYSIQHLRFVDRSETGTTATQSELAQMKAELAAAREREDTYRKEQLFLLQQMQEIRKAISHSQPLEQELRTLITDR